MSAELERIIKAPFTTEHKTVLEAISADLFDVIPVLGELAGLARIMEGLEKKDDERVILELGDLLGGWVPVLGEIFDVASPTNLILYLRKAGKL